MRWLLAIAMEIQQWCERVFEFWIVKDLKKESFFLFFLVAERQREKRSKERAEGGVTRINELSLLGVNFLCIGLNKRLGLKLGCCTGYESGRPWPLLDFPKMLPPLYLMLKFLNIR